VDPLSGQVGPALTSNTWYDSRGDVIKESQPGGQVTKTVYDGAGRATLEYSVDGSRDATYPDAQSWPGAPYSSRPRHATTGSAMWCCRRRGIASTTWR
jgi:YD repeat-containing protein